MNSPKYDIIIIGAGISGLLIGSYLSFNYSVLILEKEPLIPNNKYWLTNKRCLLNNSELEECIDSQYTFMDFKCYDGLSYRCYGDYILWDTNLLVRKLELIFIQNSGIILRDHTFYSYYYNNNSIIIKANDKKFDAKLMIDCMGYNSPIIYAKSLIEIYGYYLLHGRVLDLKKSIDPIGLSNIILSQFPKYLEIFPKQNNQAYVVLIEPERSIKASGKLNEEFKFIIEKSEFSECFYSISSGGENLRGLIPIGKLKSQALNRIFLFGEAGQMNPSSTATCLTQLLYSYKEIGDEIAKRIRNDKLDQNNLQINNPYFDNKNKQFHLHLFNNILKWKSDDFRQLILQMNKMDNNLVNDIIFGQIDFKSIANLKQFWELIKNKNYIVLNPLLKTLLS